MKTNPFVLVALVCVAAIVTGESAVVLNRAEQVTKAWCAGAHALASRVDAGKIVTRLVRGLVQAAKS